MKSNIYGYTLEQLEEYFLNIGEKKFKAIQVYDWLYKKRVSSFDEMTNIKKDIIEKLKNEFTMDKLKIVKKLSDVDVDKYLFEFNITKDCWIVRCNVFEKDFLNDELKGDLFCKISYESGNSLIGENFLNNIFAIEKEKHSEIQYWEDVFTNETFE
jgi:hypothetical protein